MLLCDCDVTLCSDNIQIQLLTDCLVKTGILLRKRVNFAVSYCDCCFFASIGFISAGGESVVDAI